MTTFADMFSTSKTTSESGDPDWKARGLDLFGTTGIDESLKTRLNQGYSPFSGDRFSALTPDQQRLEDLIRSNTQDMPGKEIFESAVWGAKNVPQVTIDPITGEAVGQGAFGNMHGRSLQDASRQRIQDVVAGQFAGTDLAPYMNPYTQEVIDANMGDINRIADMRRVAADASATRASAFGGDRAAIGRGMIDEEAIREGSSMAAKLRYEGFNAAANLVEKDLNRAMDAAGSNQLADRQTVQDAMSISADLAKSNQAQSRLSQAENAANQLKASAQLQDAFGLGTDVWRDYLGDYAAMGDRQDARNQRELDFNFAEHLRDYDYDQDTINQMISLFGVAPRDKTTEETTDIGTFGEIMIRTSDAPWCGCRGE